MTTTSQIYFSAQNFRAARRGAHIPKLANVEIPFVDRIVEGLHTLHSCTVSSPLSHRCTVKPLTCTVGWSRITPSRLSCSRGAPRRYKTEKPLVTAPLAR